MGLLTTGDEISVGGGNIWLSVLGIVSLIITVIIGPAVLEWVKARIARRSGAQVPVPVAPGLNSPLDHTAPGVTGINIEVMFSTVTDLKVRLEKAELALDVAHDEIAALQRDADFYRFVMDQVIHWGTHDPSSPPRLIPEAIKALLQRGGWI
jgi:hypothetical protein